MKINKRKVAILGSTGMVGRRFAELLVDHPWFEIGMLVGFKSIGESYEQVWERKEKLMEEHYGSTIWKKRAFSDKLRGHLVRSFDDLLEFESIDTVFSAVPAEVGHLEQQLLTNGYQIFSNSPYGRFEKENPLVIAEVNGDEIISQRFIKSPNCVTSGLGLILAPLQEAYGLREVSVVTFQSISGRGDAKYRQDLIMHNVYPLHCSDEKTAFYIDAEIKKIFGDSIPLSISCNRVFVQEGHFVDVKIKTEKKIERVGDVAALLSGFNPIREMHLPSNPSRPLLVIDEIGRPRPCQDASHGGGMTVVVGNLSTADDIFDLRLQYVVNNLVRGAAGGAILNAELYYHKNDNAVPLGSIRQPNHAIAGF
jgi:aspartate-semialdehyde dehydrogenase